jgi:hypothetical protein
MAWDVSQLFVGNFTYFASAVARAVNRRCLSGSCEDTAAKRGLKKMSATIGAC